MTIAELIERLQELPQGAELYYWLHDEREWVDYEMLDSTGENVVIG